jgi:hypothetical protein
MKIRLLDTMCWICCALVACLLLCCNATPTMQPANARAAQAKTKKPKTVKRQVPIDEDMYFKEPPGQAKKGGPAPDFVFAYNADTAEPIRLFAARGQQAHLAGVHFNKVTCAQVRDADWQPNEIDLPLTMRDSALVRTADGKVYKIGRGKLKGGRIEARYQEMICP